MTLSLVAALGLIFVYGSTSLRTAQKPKVEHLARLLAGIPERISSRPSLVPDLQRLSNAIRRLSVRPVGEVTMTELGAAVDEVLEAMFPVQALAGQHVRDERASALLTTAAIIRELFEQRLGQRVWDVQPALDELVRFRDDPAEFFARAYAAFAEPADDVHGRGPLVAAGLLTGEAWRDLGDSLRRDPGSIVPYLIDFAVGGRSRPAGPQPT